MATDVEVLILCGGEGRRLRSMVSDVPKPMATIGSKPFLDYVIRSIQNHGFSNICFLTGYKSEIIETHYQKTFENLSKRFSVEDSPLGTGGAIFKAMHSSSFEKFLIVNGDTFFNIDLKSFVETWHPGTLKIALKPIDDPSRYGRVEINNDGQVLSFVEKSAQAPVTGKALINGGIYAVGGFIANCGKVSSTFVSLENDIFPVLLNERKIFSQTFDGDFIDIGVPEDYIRAQKVMDLWLSKARY